MYSIYDVYAYLVIHTMYYESGSMVYCVLIQLIILNE